MRGPRFQSGIRRVYRSGAVFAVIGGGVLAGSLAGCAVYNKCGYDGCPGDAAISAEVRARLDHYPALEPPNLIYVQTLDHVVNLSGLVDTGTERVFAESVARSAPGVKRVVNSIAENNQPGN